MIVFSNLLFFGFFFCFGSTLLRRICVKTQNFIHHCTGWVPFYDCSIIYLPPSDEHEGRFQLWGFTNNTIVNPLVHVCFCICMKIYLGQWLSNFFDHDSYWGMTFYIMTHICVCIKLREKKKSFMKQIPYDLRHILIFSILLVRVLQILILIHLTDFTTH